MKVTFLQLAKPRQVVELKKTGTKLSEFLNRRQLSYSSKIRVNGKVVSADQALKHGDIVTMVTKSSGGM